MSPIRDNSTVQHIPELEQQYHFHFRWVGPRDRSLMILLHAAVVGGTAFSPKSESAITDGACNAVIFPGAGRNLTCLSVCQCPQQTFVLLIYTVLIISPQ